MKNKSNYVNLGKYNLQENRGDIMSSDTVNLLTKKSRAKIDLLAQSRLKYLVSAMFAGIYVGIGVILVFTIGGMLYQVHSPMTKVAVGL